MLLTHAYVGRIVPITAEVRGNDLLLRVTLYTGADVCVALV